MLTPSKTHPAIALPSDTLTTTKWFWEQDGWLPAALTVEPYATEPLAEWRVTTVGDFNYKFESIVNLPSFVAYGGLPVSIYFSFSMNNATPVLNPENWALTVDTSGFLDDAVLAPLESAFSQYGAYFSGWLKGVVRNIPTPILTLQVNAYFQADTLVPYNSGTLTSEITSNMPSLEPAQPGDVVDPSASCPTCNHRELPEGWVLL